MMNRLFSLLQRVFTTVYAPEPELRDFLKRGQTEKTPLAQVTAAVLSALSLPVVPFGTVIGAYVLVLLRSAKGRRIFARDYASIVAATPHLEPGGSRVVWIVFAVATVLGVATLVFAFVLR